MFDWLGENPAAIITVLTLFATTAFTIFAKTIINIFRLGTYFRAQYATKEDQRNFEKEVKIDLRDYKDELLRVVMAAANEMIREKFKNLDQINETAKRVEITEKELELKIKTALEKVDEIKGMADTVRSLSAKVDRLQYGQNTNDIRRKE